VLGIALILLQVVPLVHIWVEHLDHNRLPAGGIGVAMDDAVSFRRRERERKPLGNRAELGGSRMWTPLDRASKVL
jgi:hypothetical protein